MAFPVGWNRACKITCQHGQVTGNQTNYPGLIGYNCVGAEANLPQEMLVAGGGNAAKSDGSDIRFTTDAAGANGLHAEIINWTQHATVDANRRAEIRVKFNPSSSADVDIYVWYNNAGASAPAANDAVFGSQGVWSDYTAVWHVKDGSTLSLTDSTANGNSLTLPGGAANPTAAAGKIDGGAAFSFGSNQYFGVTNALQSAFTGQLSAEAWINNTQLGAGQAVMGVWGGGANNEWLIYVGQDVGNKSYSFLLVQSNGTGVSVAPATPSYTNGSWHHVAAVADGSNIIFYVDGVSIGSAAYDGTIRNNGATAFFIGKLGSNVYYWNGSQDEMKLAPTGRGATWWSTQFNNESSLSTFWVVGTPFTPSVTSVAAGLLTLGCGS